MIVPCGDATSQRPSSDRALMDLGVHNMVLIMT